MKLTAMRCIGVFFLMGISGGIFPFASAQGTPAQVASADGSGADETEKKAQALLDRERRVSDIRSRDASAFRLKAAFTFVANNLKTAQGSYIEHWVSNTRWRRESVVENYRRVEVGGATQRWEIDEPADFPERAKAVAGILNELPSNFDRVRFEDVAEVGDLDSKARLLCAQSIPGSDGEIYRVCFDGETGVLLQRTMPVTRLRNLIEYTCTYGMFKKFGDYLFPTQIRCSQDTHLDIEVKVEEIVAESSVDPGLFAAPSGAKAFPNCSTEIEPPKKISSGGIVVEPRHSGSVIVNFTIGVDGKPHDLRVVSSTDARLNKQALRSLQGWTFRPATCNNQPIAFPLDMEVSFGR